MSSKKEVQPYCIGRYKTHHGLKEKKRERKKNGNQQTNKKALEGPKAGIFVTFIASIMSLSASFT